MPRVYVHDNMELAADAYRILFNGHEMTRGELMADWLMAIDPDGVLDESVDGTQTTDPVNGLPARWIRETDRAKAEEAGCTVVPPTEVLATHLTELVKHHAHELLSCEDTRRLLDRIAASSPTVVAELVPQLMSHVAVARHLSWLLEERVSIRDLERVIESLAYHARTIKDAEQRHERLRIDLGRTICEPYRDEQGRLQAVAIEPTIEQALGELAARDKDLVNAEPYQQLLGRFGHLKPPATVLLTNLRLRPSLSRALATKLKHLAVIAFAEVPPDLSVELVATLGAS